MRRMAILVRRQEWRVRKLPNGTYGLWEWYPNAKRDKDRKKSTTSGDKMEPPDDLFDEEPNTPPPPSTEEGPSK